MNLVLSVCKSKGLTQVIELSSTNMILLFPCSNNPAYLVNISASTNEGAILPLQ